MNLADLSKNRANNITLMRLAGALFVLFGHSYALRYGPGGLEDPISEFIRPYSGFHVGLPGIGISLFFTLSGFLVAKSYHLRGDLLEYIESRALRIYPALIVAVLLSVFVLGIWATNLSVDEYLSHKKTWAYLLGNTSLLDLRFPLPGVFSDNPRNGVNGSLWTLPVEVWMYICVAILGMLGILNSRNTFNLFVLFTILLYLASPKTFPLITNASQVRLGIYFLIGAFFYINADRIPLNYTLLISLLITALASHGSVYFNFIFALFFSYLTLMIAFHPSMKLPGIDHFGDLSYGVYIYAFPVQQSIIYINPDSDPALISVLTLSIVIPLAVLSWNYIEKPCLRLKGTTRKYLPRLKTGIR